jgi:2-haloacid dehalogenase
MALVSMGAADVASRARRMSADVKPSSAMPGRERASDADGMSIFVDGRRHDGSQNIETLTGVIGTQRPRDDSAVSASTRRTAMSASRPSVLIFDVNETLSDLTPLRARFADVGAPEHLMPTWFAGVLRDGFALTAAGAYADFASVARDGLAGLLPAVPGWDGDVEHAAGYILAGFGELRVHPDVPDGVRRLKAAGFRLATMTNGSHGLTADLLAGAGVLDCFEALLDIRGPRRWKPAPGAYLYAADHLRVLPGQAMLVAVHPWDVDGAIRAGLGGAWLRRAAAAYPSTMSEPTCTARDVAELAAMLTEA